ncbi:Uncharacterised protein [Shewanella baltica]|uniref:hypothetical protein n=1 Tax=Shewanella TaxID=22 RepID=UPI000F706FE8|nr:MULTISPECIES: hypothetical protein [Shewanella]WAL80077.1 hypothetical protein OX890_08035 [Shewanella sp. DAU305]VEF25175.1 Uncharacterised protein [Shewanella baltica]
MKRLMLFLVFILSIPSVIIAAFVFEDIGGHILFSWFSFTLGLIGIGGILRFREDQFLTYDIVEGTIISLDENTRYSPEHEHFRYQQIFINPVIEYFWQGKRYTRGTLINYDEQAYTRFGPQIGDKISLCVPINCPEEAIENKFLSRYIHLIIGLISISISIALAVLLFSY